MLPESHYRPSKYKVDKRSVYENLKTGLLCSKVCSVQQHVHDIINYVHDINIFFYTRDSVRCLMVIGFH